MRETQGFLVLLDISGYTEYVRSHNLRAVPWLGKKFRKTSEMHAETVITDLLETMITELDGLLVLNKLEGDAALFYREAPNTPAEANRIVESVNTLFDVFNQRIHHLIFCQTCLCDCCQQMQQLRVKVFVHYGPYLIKNVSRFEEIAGQEVILIHRLMKNQINADEYLLLTDPMARLVSLSQTALTFEKRVETYDVGKVGIHVHFPGKGERESAELFAQGSWWSRFQKMKAYFSEPRTRAQIQLKLRP